MINIVKKEENIEFVGRDAWWAVTIYSECGYVGTGWMKDTYSEAIDAAMKDLVSHIIDDA